MAVGVLGGSEVVGEGLNERQVDYFVGPKRDVDVAVRVVRAVIIEVGDRRGQRIPDPVLKRQNAFSVDVQPAAFCFVDQTEIVENVLSELEVVVVSTSAAAGMASELNSAGGNGSCRAGRIVNLGKVEDGFDASTGQFFVDVDVVGDGLGKTVEVIDAVDFDGVVAIEAELVVVVDDAADEQQLGFAVQTDQPHRCESWFIVGWVVIRRIASKRVEHATSGRVVKYEAHGAGRELVVDVASAAIDLNVSCAVGDVCEVGESIEDERGAV